jgi:hypothetical protein
MEKIKQVSSYIEISMAKILQTEYLFTRPAITKYPKKVGLNNNKRNLLLTVLEVGKSKINMPAGWVSSENLLPGHSWSLSHCILAW